MEGGTLNRYFWWFIFFVLSYWPIAIWDEETSFMLAILNAIGVAAATGVFVSFTPVIFQIFRLPYGAIERAHIHIFGLWCLSLAGSIRFSWLWIYRLQVKIFPDGRVEGPEYMLQSDFFGWGTWLFMIGCISLLVADRGGPHNMPRKEWLRIGYTVFIGLAAALISITLIRGYLSYD